MNRDVILGLGIITLVMAVAAACRLVYDVSQFLIIANEAYKEGVEQHEQLRIPRVVKEIDGCKVYAFIQRGILTGSDKTLYVTLCPNRTVTEQKWKECSGAAKFRTCTEVSDVVTTN